MNFSLFWQVFENMFIAVGKIFLVAFIGGILVRRKVLSREHIQGLSEATVKVFLPSLVITNILSTFKPASIDNWWILPLVGIVAPMILLGIAMLFFLPNLKQNLSKLPLASFQNAGYLVLPVGQIIFPAQFDQFALYIFLFLLGFTPILWSIGKMLITKEHEEKFRIKGLFTPPFVANILGVVMVFLHLNKIPAIIFEPIELLGKATIPVATFILGATIGAISLKKLPNFWLVTKLISVKYILSPILTISIILLLKLQVTNPLMADFLVIESSAAPAANLIVMVRKYGGDEQLTASMMFIMYVMAIVTMPLSLAIWRIIEKMF